jgi:putative lipoic acid-binding regulatory protein
LKKNEIKIKFPQDNYPFKVICDNNTQIIDSIISILHKHETFSNKQKYSSKISKESKYVSYSFELYIKSPQILSEVFKQIKKIDGVIMCL